ncbi:hypothetical protein Ct9H90mP29_16810 [bacterium]|nr:MAG: hypothetical protein Ct9H90mP29_16810 [bacterium]
MIFMTKIPWEKVFDVDIHTAIDIDLYKFIWVEDNFHSGL